MGVETESYAAVSQGKYMTWWRQPSSPTTPPWWCSWSCFHWCQWSQCQLRVHNRVETQPDYSEDASPADPGERKETVGIHSFLLNILKELTEDKVSTQLLQRFLAALDGAVRSWRDLTRTLVITIMVLLQRDSAWRGPPVITRRGVLRSREVTRRSICASAKVTSATLARNILQGSVQLYWPQLWHISWADKVPIL